MAVDRSDVLSLIHEFFAEHEEGREYGVNKFSESHDLFENGDLDSFGFVELLSFLVGRTGRRIDLSNLDPSELTRVGAIVSYFSGEKGADG